MTTNAALVRTPMFTVNGVDFDNNDEVSAAYSNADKAGKAAIRKAVNDGLMAAVKALDIESARNFQNLAESLKSVAPSAPKVDPTELIVRRIAELRLAAEALELGQFVPEGIESEEIDYVELAAQVKSLMSDSDIPALVESVSKLATAKITRKSQTGDRRSIGAWISRAAESIESGQFVTVSQLVNLGVDPENAEDTYRPSGGAIAARLYPSKGETSHDLYADGLELATNEKGVKGVRGI